MKTSNFLRSAELVLALLFVVSIVPVPSDAAPVNLSYANFSITSKLPYIQMERWKTEVEKRTDGNVVIKTFPEGTLLGLENMLDGVIAGKADIGCLFLPFDPEKFTITNAMALPFGFPDATVATLTLWDIYQKYNLTGFAEVKLLTLFTSAPANIYSKRPVRKLEDLKGLGLRASGEVARALSALGATTVGIPEYEAFKALQRGTVQGAVSSLDDLMHYKYAKICKYVTIFNGPVYPFAVIMNKKKWDALPEEVKTVFHDLGSEHALWTGAYLDNRVEESLTWSKKNYNIKVTTLTPGELVRWNKLFNPLFHKWVTEATAKGLPARAIVRDIRVANEYHSQFKK